MSRMSVDRHDEILSTALHLVATHGFDGVTIDQIAAATSASKATIYRQWGGKVGLVTAGLARIPIAPEEIADRGSFREDLRWLLMSQAIDWPQITALLPALIHAATKHRELYEAIESEVLTKAEEVFAHVVTRAVNRGEIPSGHAGLAFVLPLMLNMPLMDPNCLAGDSEFNEAAALVFVDTVILPVVGLPPHSSGEN